MTNNRMTLQFKVDNQHISRLDNFIVVEKSIEYLYAHFTFSDDWNGLNKKILIRPFDIDASYALELNSKNTCKIPYNLILFPGFVISARGESQQSVIITADGIGVDVELALIEDGKDNIPVSVVTSTNNTINISKQEENLDIGLETSLEYNIADSTLKLNAITHNEKDEHGEPITVVTEIANTKLDVKCDFNGNTFPNTYGIIKENATNEITKLKEIINQYSVLSNDERIHLQFVLYNYTINSNAETRDHSMFCRFVGEGKAQVGDIYDSYLFEGYDEHNFYRMSFNAEDETDLTIRGYYQLKDVLDNMSILPSVVPREMSILQQGEINLLAELDNEVVKVNMNDLDYAKLKVTESLNEIRNNDFIFSIGE